MHDLLALADEALFVVLPHVGEELVVAEETFPAELAERVYATLDVVFLLGIWFGLAMWDRWEMEGKLIGGI